MLIADPEGGAHGRAPFFDHGMDAVSKNPGALSVRDGGVSGKALTFGDFSLGQQRKVTRRFSGGSR